MSATAAPTRCSRGSMTASQVTAHPISCTALPASWAMVAASLAFGWLNSPGRRTTPPCCWCQLLQVPCACGCHSMLRLKQTTGRHPRMPSFPCCPCPAPVDPLEVMFIKVKASMRAANWPHVAAAVKFDQWLAASGQRDPLVLAAGAATCLVENGEVVGGHAVRGGSWRGCSGTSAVGLCVS